MEDLTPEQSNLQWEQPYIKARKLEGRIYSDEEVRNLPFIDDHHQYQSEWKIRGASFRKLEHRLEAKKTPLRILDVGCGNGWMSHRLSEIDHSTVTGLDLNLLELEQAKRVFHDSSNLSFVYGNLFDGIFPPQHFDIIVVAGAIQYFPDLKKLIERLFYFLKSGGELFIIDSPIYKESGVEAARQRSKFYYERLGIPEMAEHYFHHSWNELYEFKYRILNRSFLNILSLKIFRNKSLIFPFVAIKNRN